MPKRLRCPSEAIACLGRHPSFGGQTAAAAAIMWGDGIRDETGRAPVRSHRSRRGQALDRGEDGGKAMAAAHLQDQDGARVGVGVTGWISAAHSLKLNFTLWSISAKPTVPTLT